MGTAQLYLYYEVRPSAVADFRACIAETINLVPRANGQDMDEDLCYRRLDPRHAVSDSFPGINVYLSRERHWQPSRAR